ncbi:dual specificity protein kinase shkD-like isoform X2 [Triticum urartu]|uniref:dual specificity protein kinase shkD-like isoform X2 n=1 Tax=Triticum urartu TaxID=4572 RepID=UPI002043452A|nr:dual specificity protein kinase shkD-like isoform X2 [Triticum urartu]
MEADELLRKIRELEEGQAQLVREMDRRAPGPGPSRRPAFPPRHPSSSRRGVAALPDPSPGPRQLRDNRARLSDRHCHWILQSLGQAVHIIAPDGKLLYWNRYAEHMYGYSASEAIGQDAIELIVHPTDFDAAKEIFSPSTTEKSCQSSSKPHFHDNNRPKSGSQNKGSSDSQQPLQSASTSKITTFATKLTSRVRSRIRTGQNCERQCASGCEEQYSEHDVRANLTTSEASTPNEDVRFGVFAAEEKSPRELSKTSTDNPGEGKVGFHKKISSKAEALLAKKGISWPRKGRENDGGSGKSNITSTHLHDKQENDQSHQRVPVVEPIMIPDCQDTEYAQSSKYEFSGSWWTFNNTSSMNSTSTIGSPIERVDYEADCLDYEILWEDLIIGEQVGQGSCGTVYHALWCGSDVAVKLFSKQEYSEEMINAFRQEVSLMKKLRHPSIILFMGAVASQERLCIVTEFLPRGSLFQLLQKNTAKLDPRRKLSMAIDIARGMNYLHNSIPTIVHRDLKSSNLLVDKNWTVKVADFGLSRLKLETFLTTKGGKGTPQWMAPEVLRSEPSNEKSDVYSYGVVLWELVTQKIPWDTLNPMQIIAAVGFMDRRLEIPSNTDPQWASIIESCWDSDPQCRPSFQELLERLQDLQKQCAVQARTRREAAGKGAGKMNAEDC